MNREKEIFEQALDLSPSENSPQRTRKGRDRIMAGQNHGGRIIRVRIS